MKNKVGLWIDHREAVVVVLNEKEVVTIKRIPSHVEKNHRLAGGARSVTPYGPQDVASERQFQERRMHQLVRFFDDVVDYIGSAQQIFIMGPGEGKHEFARHLQKSHELKERVAAVETCDKKTENQLVEAVKIFYGLPTRRGRQY